MGDALGIDQQRGSTCVLLSMQEENPENVLNTAELSNDILKNQKMEGKINQLGNTFFGHLPHVFIKMSIVLQ